MKNNKTHTIFFYLILKNIFKKNSIALIGLAITSFSPWFIHYGRK